MSYVDVNQSKYHHQLPGLPTSLYSLVKSVRYRSNVYIMWRNVLFELQVDTLEMACCRLSRLVDALGRLHPLLHHPLADHETGEAVGDPSPHLLGLYGAPLHLATLLHAVDS